MKADVIIQSCPQRAATLRETIESVEASDIGHDYEVAMHPAGMSLNDFFYAVLKRMSEATTEYVIRLEDDALVNRHILHNVLSWPAVQDPEFGGGWLFVPHGLMGPSWFSAHRMTKNGEMYRTKFPLHSSVGYMFKTETLPKIIEAMHTYDDDKRYNGGMMDFGVSLAIEKLGLKLFLHVPSLVEHNLKIPSAMQHTYDSGTATAGGLFKPDWRR